MSDFIVLEGLSGTGKSTVAKILAKRLGAVLYKTPGATFLQAQAILEGRVINNARFLFFIAGLIQSSAEISAILKTKSVVCDRYLLTTTLNHQAMGVPVEKLFPLKVLKTILTPPDYTFLLTCPNEVRLKRMGRRGLSEVDKTEERGDINKKILNGYKKCRLPEIDNSSDDPRIAVSQILAVINS